MISLTRIFQSRFYALAAVLLLTACGTNSAHNAPSYAQAPDTQESFEVASVVGEDTLSDMRGGFISAGGLSINFGLTSTTLVNGTIASSINLSSNNVHDLIPQNLQQLVQVGSSNTFSASPATLGNNVVTLIQNTTNNTVIQNSNVLNITVSNFASLRNSIALANSIGPLVRGLH